MVLGNIPKRTYIWGSFLQGYFSGSKISEEIFPRSISPDTIMVTVAKYVSDIRFKLVNFQSVAMNLKTV